MDKEEGEPGGEELHHQGVVLRSVDEEEVWQEAGRQGAGSARGSNASSVSPRPSLDFTREEEYGGSPTSSTRRSLDTIQEGERGEPDWSSTRPSLDNSQEAAQRARRHSKLRAYFSEHLGGRKLWLVARYQY